MLYKHKIYAEKIKVYHAVNHTYQTIEKKAVEPCAMTSYNIINVYILMTENWTD